MRADFDTAAKAYDSTFTHTKIGQRQRQVVWNHVDNILNKDYTKKSILELNCGTGEDARHFAEAGHQVLATDISEEMLTVTLGKCQALPNVSTQQLDLSNLPKIDQSFDLIFSNFGGLNCIDRNQLRLFSTWAEAHLNTGGQLILVIMPRDTLIERWYRKFKGDKQLLSLRQSNKPTQVNVDGQAVSTYFYNPEELEEIFSEFKMKKCLATGYVPSYWSGHRMESLLLVLSKLFSLVGLSGKYGDHYLVEMVKSTGQ